MLKVLKALKNQEYQQKLIELDKQEARYKINQAKKIIEARKNKFINDCILARFTRTQADFLWKLFEEKSNKEHNHYTKWAT